MIDMHYIKHPVLLLLKQPITEKEYRNLETDIYYHGCLTPILVWDKYIVDGCKRYDICHAQNIPFHISRMEFKELKDVISYICETELERSDLTAEMRKYLIGKKYLTDVDISAREFILHPPKEYQNARLSLPAKPNRKYEVASAIGKKYNIATGTVFKYGYFTRYMETLREKDADLASGILASTLKVSHENMKELVRLPAEDLHNLRKTLDENNMNHIGYSEIRHELQWKNIHESKARELLPDKSTPLIRKIPEYDPDAEVSSLSLTIPSWISSINRVETNAELEKISPAAAKKLKAQLARLIYTADSLVQSLEDKEDDRK
jgi:hypothetical protein